MSTPDAGIFGSSTAPAKAPGVAGRTCLVTGGAGGLGKAVAEAFLRAGANVVICDIHEERLAQTAKELGELGPLASFVVDVTVETQVRQLFDDTAARFGKVDILINNAGLPDRFQPVGDVDMDLWDKVIAVNLTAPVLMSKFAVKSMATGTTGGCIINMASVASKAGVLSGVAYVASKHGLLGITKSTAVHYRDKGIGCVALLIGLMAETNMSEHITDIHQQAWARASKVMLAADMKPISMETLAGYCVKLAEDNCSLFNGSCVTVDGGFSTVLG
ncbi:hypothetical protein MCOR02_010568 [Pyricularia oryzae]|nr:hypothetical protein MCOR02_010568 [Pyricularia oryzae]KAI6321961.1 putative secondary metabolism biosynthetic enzyme [Pyricularia oryzae]KAI6455711.1 putative secondary metabolism biosynthetic enzyme [Pyricularia oryzae]KAI6505352.1 hypothetical protein MCOR13_004296 [Pyricularia oryzae]KAI6608281.1 putative secondary metabolism biosynthetic enzyme [Pyricularia oryzae]